jgi:hypothetical protein
MMRRGLSILAAAFALMATPFSLYSAVAASAALTWERGRYQLVEIDTAISAKVTHLDLIGSGQTLEFTGSNVKTNRTTYQVLVPSNFPIGQYAIRAYFNDGSTFDYADVRLVEYQSQGYNPAVDLKTTGALTLTFFTLLALWAGNTGLDNQDSKDETTYEGIDANKIAATKRAKDSYKKGLISSIGLDQFRSVLSIRLGRYSPLGARLAADGGYLQYSLGALVLFFPIFGLVLGALCFNDIHGVGHITTPSLALGTGLIVLSCLDASAGFLGFITFTVLALTSKFITNPYDFRTLLGLGLLWITPALIAGGTRPLRRSVKDVGWWERLTDILLGSLITGWAVKSLVVGLNGFAHLKLPLSAHAGTCGLFAGVAIGVRYLIEEYVNRRNHVYLSYLSPTKVHDQDSSFKLMSWFIKGILYVFFAVAFLGVHWQLFAALALFMAPNIIKEFKERFPNSSVLFQVIPVGIPAVVIIGLLNRGYQSWIDGMTLDPASKTRTLFILLALPSFILTIVKMFARNPKPGDQRWYLRPKMKVVYRTAGPLMLGLGIAMTLGVI